MLGVSYLGPPDLSFPSGHGESSRYTVVLTVYSGKKKKENVLKGFCLRVVLFTTIRGMGFVVSRVMTGGL